MTQFFSINILTILPIFLGGLNLLTPFLSKEDSKLRSIFIIIVNIFFLLNVIILDYLFLNGIKLHYTLLSFGKFVIAFHLESLGMIFLSLIATLWLCASLYTINFLAINKIQNSNRFLFFLNCCIISGVLIALSANIFTMFIAYEALTLFTIPLISHTLSEETIKNLSTYLKILMITSLGLFLPAMVIIYNIAGTGDFIIGGFIGKYFTQTQSILLLLAFIFGIAKAALYPVNSWLPASMVAAYPVSALLHAVVVVKAGLFCIYKLMLYVFGLDYLQTLFSTYNWLVLLPAAGVIYSSIQAIYSSKIKALLAYSTITQLNIALMSAFMLTPKGIIGAVIHMVSHSFTKICLFYACGNFYTIAQTYKIKDLAYIKAIMPKTSLIMLLSCLSLIGIPPFAGFISKFYIFMAAAEQLNLLAIVTLVFSSICSAWYVVKMLTLIYQPYNPDSLPSEKNLNAGEKLSKKLPTNMIFSLILCLCFVLGFIFIQQILIKFLALI